MRWSAWSGTRPGTTTFTTTRSLPFANEGVASRKSAGPGRRSSSARQILDALAFARVLRRAIAPEHGPREALGAQRVVEHVLGEVARVLPRLGRPDPHVPDVRAPLDRLEERLRERGRSGLADGRAGAEHEPRALLAARRDEDRVRRARRADAQEAIRDVRPPGLVRDVRAQHRERALRIELFERELAPPRAHQRVALRRPPARRAAPRGARAFLRRGRSRSAARRRASRPARRAAPRTPRAPTRARRRRRRAPAPRSSRSRRRRARRGSPRARAAPR